MNMKRMGGLLARGRKPAMPTSIKLQYFDAFARGEMVRLTMVVGKIEFEDARFPQSDWLEVKPTTPLGSVPVATIDGTEVCQSIAQVRYFGKLGGLYPTDPWKALMVDQVIDTMLDMQSAIFATQSKPEDEAGDYIKDATSRYWGGADKIIRGISPEGPYVLGDEITIADVVVAFIGLFVKSAFVTEVPVDTLDGFPRMDQIRDELLKLPQVLEWYKKHPIPNVPL